MRQWLGNAQRDKGMSSTVNKQLSEATDSPADLKGRPDRKVVVKQKLNDEGVRITMRGRRRLFNAQGSNEIEP